MNSCRGSPRALGIGIALEVAVVYWVGVDKHAGSAVLLRNIGLHAAEIVSVAREHDLAAHINLHFFQLLKILRTAIIGVDHLCLRIAGGGIFVERQHHAWIFLITVAFHVFTSWPMHVHTIGRDYLYADLLRIVHPHFVSYDLRFKTGLAKFLSHVLGGLPVLRRSRNMGCGSKDA